MEVRLARPRATSTAGLLGALRNNPEFLVPSDGREIRALRVVTEGPNRGKRTTGAAGFIKSVRDLTNRSYAHIVQYLQRPAAKISRAATSGTPTGNQFQPSTSAQAT